MTPRTLRFHTAGVRLDIDVADEAVRTTVAWAGAGMLAGARPGPADVVLAEPPVPSPTIEARAAAVLAQVDRAALSATLCLTVHAAVLAGPRGTAVVPGASGLGKSTLAGAAMQLGLDLVSDEAACFAEPVGELWPHARPLGLDGRSRSLLGLGVDNAGEDELAMPPSALGRTAPGGRRVRCTHVVVPTRRLGGPATTTAATAAEGLVATLSCCLNVPSRNPGGWRREDAWAYLSRLMRDVQVVRCSYADPQGGAARLVELVGSTA